MHENFVAAFYILTCTDVCHIATEPMQPIEDRAVLSIWRWTEECTNWLQEANDCCDCSQNGMWIFLLRPSAQFDEDQYECRDSQSPCQHHATTMPLCKIKINK